MLFGATGEDRRYASYAQFGCLFDSPLHVIELEDGEEEVEGKGSVGLEFLVEGEEDLIFADAGDLGPVEEASSYDVEDLAGFCAEDSGEVGGLIAGEGGGGGGPGIGDEAAAGHLLSGYCVSLELSLGWSEVATECFPAFGMVMVRGPWW
jgi:hypothetical protein